MCSRCNDNAGGGIVPFQSCQRQDRLFRIGLGNLVPAIQQEGKMINSRETCECFRLNATSAVLRHVRDKFEDILPRSHQLRKIYKKSQSPFIGALLREVD